MTIVVGLGNPGRRYQGTRHNIGFAVADEVARRRQAEFESGRGERHSLFLRSGAIGFGVAHRTSILPRVVPEPGVLKWKFDGPSERIPSAT